MTDAAACHGRRWSCVGTTGGDQRPWYRRWEQQRLLKIRRTIEDEIHRSSSVGAVGPAPESQRQRREGQGIDGAHRIAAAVAEQGGLTGALRVAAKQRSLMAMEPLLPGLQLIGIQHQLRGG